MTPQETANPLRVLKRWQRVRNVTGTLAICAALATVAVGLIALSKEGNTSSAMKLPATAAFLALWGFAHAQKKILELRKANKLPEPMPG